MRRPVATLAVCAALTLAGCVSVPSGGGGGAGHSKWWNPLTWGRSPVARVEARQAELANNEAAMVHAAQIETHKTGVALETVPASDATDVARRTHRNAAALLDAAAGPLPLDVQQQGRDIVAGLIARTAEAERDQARAESHAADLSADNAALRAELSAAQGKLASAYAVERRLANRLRGIYWIAGGLVVLWLLGNVLAAAARFNPALAGVSTIVNGVVNPALAVAHRRAVAGLERVGEAVQTARVRAPEIADRFADFLNVETDAEHQAIIGRAAKNYTVPAN